MTWDRTSVVSLAVRLPRVGREGSDTLGSETLGSDGVETPEEADEAAEDTAAEAANTHTDTDSTQHALAQLYRLHTVMHCI